MSASLAVGGTYALFTSESKVNVAITSGKVEVVAYAENLDLYSPTSIGLDGVIVDATDAATTDTFKNGGTATIDGNTLTLDRLTPGDKATFDLVVENNSNVAIQYRVKLACEGSLFLFAALDFTVGGEDFSRVRSYISAWSSLAAEEDPATVAVEIALPMDSGNEYQTLSTSIVYTVEAVQGNAATTNESTKDYVSIATTTEELSEAFAASEAGGTVVLPSGSIVLPAAVVAEGVTIQGNGAENTTLVTSSTGYTVSNDNVTISDVTIDGTAASGQGYGGGAIVLKGDGSTISNAVISGGGRSTYGASVYIGLSAGETAYVENTTISGGFRGIFLGSQSGSVVVDGCDIDAVYPISVDGGGEFTVTVKNSRLHGWTSYSEIASASFENTEFSMGNSGYDFLRPYADTTFTNCTFDEDFTIGAGAAVTITLNDCYKNGVLITADNYSTLDVFDMTGDDGTYLLQCTVYINGVQVTLS